MPTPASTPASKEVVDPVCGMTIDPADAVGRIDHQGQTYYFCADSCLERFKANPEEYVKPADGRIPNPEFQIPARAAKWTCPMHPEIVRDGPGSCPICGMALEPRVATADDRNPELDDMSRRLRLSLLFTAPIFALMISEFLPGKPLQGIVPHS